LAFILKETMLEFLGSASVILVEQLNTPDNDWSVEFMEQLVLKTGDDMNVG